MGHLVTEVEPGGIADQLGIRAGDELISVCGENVIDWVDYQALTSAEKITLIMRRNAEETEYSFEKDDYEPLGMRFAEDMTGGVRACANKCVFCFVDQLPRGCRETMRVKDDDWRLSLMTGSYVTLTNVGEAELERIIRRGASPLYISVHATSGELRNRLLGTDRADMLMTQLEKLAEGGIRFHAQAVLCPGLNDGEELEKTIRELACLYPACQSLALVPVGLTGCREGLAPIRAYTADTARETLALAAKWRTICLRELDTRFVFPADELYVLAGEEIPADSEYEDYAQIDNGVGLLRALIAEFEDAYEALPGKLKKSARAAKKIGVATGVAAQPYLKKLLNEHPVSGVDVTVYPVRNRFFGESVTVAGLVTGGDLVSQLRGKNVDAFLITECMLRSEGDRFLDDMTLTEAVNRLNRPIVPVGRKGEDLLDAIVKFAK